MIDRYGSIYIIFLTICHGNNIFSIFIILSKAEYIFSSTKYTISDKWALPYMTMVKMLEYLESWLWAGLFINNKLSYTIK